MLNRRSTFRGKVKSTWNTFITDHHHRIVATDFFTVDVIGFLKNTEPAPLSLTACLAHPCC